MGFASAAIKQGISLEKSSKRGLTLIFLFKKTKRRVFISNLDEVTKLHHLKYKRGWLLFRKRRLGTSVNFAKELRLNIMNYNEH